MEQKDYIKNLLTESVKPDYKTWKKKNVTLRGMSNGVGEENMGGAKYGEGLYTAPLSNKAMAKQYGDVYFVVNAIPSNPKTVNSVNEAEMFLHRIVSDFCSAHDIKRNIQFFNEHTTIANEVLKLGYDGLIIKGREMVNYLPMDVMYFQNERQLMDYYETI